MTERITESVGSEVGTRRWGWSASPTLSFSLLSGEEEKTQEDSWGSRHWTAN